MTMTTIIGLSMMPPQEDKHQTLKLPLPQARQTCVPLAYLKPPISLSTVMSNQQWTITIRLRNNQRLARRL